MVKLSAKLGKNLKKARLMRGMSQGDISRKLGMDRGFISLIENGQQNVTLASLEKLARALDIPPADLLK